MKRFCALLSGGKDSNYALYRALEEGFEPSCILVVTSRRRDSWMFHTIATGLATLQVEAMGLSNVLVKAEVSGIKEAEVGELHDALKHAQELRGFNVIVVGALASTYQRQRIEKIAEALGVEIYAPAWGVDHEYYLRHLVSIGFRIIITRVSTMGLPLRFLGKILTMHDVDEIIARSRRFGFHPAFEGGEAETLVIDAPHYKKALLVEAEPVVYSEYEAELLISGASLVEKGRGGVRLITESRKR